MLEATLVDLSMRTKGVEKALPQRLKDGPPEILQAPVLVLLEMAEE